MFCFLPETRFFFSADGFFFFSQETEKHFLVSVWCAPIFLFLFYKQDMSTINNTKYTGQVSKSRPHSPKEENTYPLSQFLILVVPFINCNSLMSSFETRKMFWPDILSSAGYWTQPGHGPQAPVLITIVYFPSQWEREKWTFKNLGLVLLSTLNLLNSPYSRKKKKKKCCRALYANSLCHK